MAYVAPPQWQHGDIPTAALMNRYRDSLNALKAVFDETPQNVAAPVYEGADEDEAEADDYALAWMDRHQIPREAWADMLRNLEAAVNTEGWQPGFLASHPRTEDRIGKAGELRR